eukprot:scaffold3791_cov390-Prasinococcus_capsulatus_cf.AAC.24
MTHRVQAKSHATRVPRRYPRSARGLLHDAPDTLGDDDDGGCAWWAAHHHCAAQPRRSVASGMRSGRGLAPVVP